MTRSGVVMKFVLGQAVPRTEDPRLLSGRGRYTDDFVLPRLWPECRDNECFFFTLGDKPAVDAAFAKARHVTGLKPVFNRVTAATIEPRGCIGDWDDFPNGCHVCEVEVDPETGATEVLRYVVIDDVGIVANKLTLEGQIHGGDRPGLHRASRL
jgi:CO/xanthine dehydrogenase Mo-binding subunit